MLRAETMPPQPIHVVNCARGGVVNDGDVAAALRDGRVLGAGIDCEHDFCKKNKKKWGLTLLSQPPMPAAARRHVPPAISRGVRHPLDRRQPQHLSGVYAEVDMLGSRSSPPSPSFFPLFRLKQVAYGWSGCGTVARHPSS